MRFSIAILVIAAACGCDPTETASDEYEIDTPIVSETETEETESIEQPGRSEFVVQETKWELAEESQFETNTVSVLAGDLIETTMPTGETRQLNLYAIAAPKAGQPMHEQSKLGLGQHLKNRTVTIRIRKIRESQIMIDLKVPPNNPSTGGPHGHNLPPNLVNGDMVRWGLAWHNSKEVPDSDSMSDRQKSAKENRRGLWGESDSPTPPWEWKQD